MRCATFVPKIRAEALALELEPATAEHYVSFKYAKGAKQQGKAESNQRRSR